LGFGPLEVEDTIEFRSLEMNPFLIEKMPAILDFRNEHCAFLRV
jgi:hypothetical protein